MTVENMKREGRKRSERKEGSGIENLIGTQSLKILISTRSKEQSFNYASKRKL